jgi:uncharacterized protein YbcI
MKGNPAVPGGSLTSKPTRPNTTTCSAASVFFWMGWREPATLIGTDPMDKFKSSMAQQVALAAIDFEEQRTGRAPESVAAVMSDETLVITLHAALSPAEKALARTPEGAAQVQELHRQLFNDSGDSLRQAIKRITGVDVREAAVEIDTTTGTVLKAFTTGTIVQVFLLAGKVAAESWSNNGRDGRHENGSRRKREDSPSGKAGVS